MDNATAVHDGNLTVSALSRQSGCSIDTIRYYERIQLLPKIQRTAGGRRLYGSEHIRRLTFIRRSRGLGLSLDQVRNILGSTEHKTCGCSEGKTVLVQCAAEVRRRIEELQKLEKSLCSMIKASGDAESANGHVIEALLAGEDTPLDSGCRSQPSG